MNCDLIAPWYRWMEYASFGGALQNRRTHFLSCMNAKKVLLLGDGDGRFLARLARLYPSSEIDVVDVSPRMLALAKHRAPASDRIRFHKLDVIRDPPPGANYDLVITHFFLDCFTAAELPVVVEKVSDTLAPHARWILSEFHEPARGWRHWHARLWINSLYSAFRLLTGLRAQELPDYAAELEAIGFTMQEQSFSRGQLLTSQIWQREPPGNFPANLRF